MATPTRKITGYEKLAVTMSKHDDLGIFRRFATLNAQNLLYLQAEMHALEWQFQSQFDQDLNSSEKERKYYALDWGTLDRVYQDSTDKSTDENSQMRLILKLREKIKELMKDLPDEAVLLYASTTKLPHPPKSRSAILSDILDRQIPFPDRLLSFEKTIWQDETLRADLVSLNAHVSQDPITRWLVDAFLGPYHRLIGKRYKTPDDSDAPATSLWEYKSTHLQYPAFVLTMVLSSLLPVAAIVILFKVESMGVRLGILAAFTAVFSLLLSLIIPERLTKRVEIFAATAAFSAVQVVFLSSDSTSSCCPNAAGN